MNQQPKQQIQHNRTKHFIYFLFTAAFLALVLNSCATMIEGSKQEIRVHCEPADNVYAVVDGSEEPFNNGIVYLDKSRNLHFVTFSRKYYHSSTVAFNRKVNPFWMVADLIWLPAFPIAWLVDWATGSLYKIEPQDIHVVLRSNEKEIR